jgi:hypothetical protein
MRRWARPKVSGRRQRLLGTRKNRISGATHIAGSSSSKRGIRLAPPCARFGLSGLTDPAGPEGGVRIVTERHANPDPRLPLFDSGNPTLSEQVEAALEE